MLGELYTPKGLALETAQAVLEVEEPEACNIAVGCSNDCGYCYGPQFFHVTRESWANVRKASREPAWLVRRQILRRAHKASDIKGVFLSFATDPFIRENCARTEELIDALWRNDVPLQATLSKKNISRRACYAYMRSGMTVVSVDSKFWRRWEPRTLPPFERLQLLEREAIAPWLSMEPYPVSAIHKQSLPALLERLKFADLIVFGKWNYDARANTETARQEYAEAVAVLGEWGKSNGVRIHVKTDTLNFIKGGT